MQQKKSQKRSYLTNAALAALSLVVAIGIFLIARVQNESFRLQNILIDSPGASIKLQGLENYIGKNVLLIFSKQMSDDLYSKNPFIKSIRVEKEYPHTIRLFITTYKPFAQIRGDTVFFIVSDDGRILKKIKNQDKNLPLIKHYQRLSSLFFTLGDKITYNDIVVSLLLLRDVGDLGLSTMSIDISSPNMVAFTLKDRKIFFSTQKDYAVSSYELKQIIEKFRIEGRDFKSLDLRFTKPVIRF